PIVERLNIPDLALAVAEIGHHQSEADKATAELEPVKRDLFDKNTQITAAEGELAAINLSLAEKQAAAAKFSEEIAAATHKVGTLEGEIKRCADLAEEMRRQIKVSEEEDATAGRRLAELEPALQELSRKVEEAVAQLAPVQADFEAKHALLGEAEAGLVALSAEQDRNNAEMLRLTQAEVETSSKAAGLASGIAHYEQDLLSNEKDLYKTEQDLKAQSSRAEELKNSCATQKQAVETLRQALAALESARAELAAKKDNLSASLSNAKSAAAAASAKLELARAQGGKDPYWVGTQAVLGASLAGVRGTLRNHLSVKPEDGIYAEEALGRFMDSVLCDSRAVAESAAELVKSAGAARCRFIILEEVPRQQASQTQTDLFSDLKSRISYPPEWEGLMAALAGGCSIDGTRQRGPF
ncbi:MAG TPA: hypothetical protein PLL10_06265, partial [Elusimicrobiales bacterium]|nr:hypothetical protein [Elusimicrobiales bacterium]